MSLISLKLAPGVKKTGTDYESKGRWFDADLIRWFGPPEGPSLQPIGGWVKVTDSSDVALDLAEPIRGLLGWRSNSGIAQLALGTAAKAYAFVLGTLTDITPAGFTVGTESATTPDGNGEYGDGLYGDGIYGGVVTDTRNQIIEAGSWQFDSWDDLGNADNILLAVAFPDQTLYSWDLNVLSDLAVVTNAPACNAVIVTPEGSIMALATGGGRRVIEWNDRNGIATGNPLTSWDGDNPAAGSEAGIFPLVGKGEILFGRRARTETLIFTSTDLWAARYVGGPIVYGFVQLGNNCGAISRHCAAEAGAATYWMTKRGFYRYDGAVTPIPCDVADYVFGDINWTQISKVCAVPVSEFGEIYWHYPSAGSEENDRYVCYNYLLDIWYIGTLSRTSGIDRGAHLYPLQVDATGAVYEHEQTGAEATYDDPSGVEMVPFAESGPVELGEGDQVLTVLYLIPDDLTAGDVDATLTLQYFPDGDETVFGPFNLSEQTSIRKTARTVRLKLRQVQPQWRVGVPRLDVRAGGRR